MKLRIILNGKKAGLTEVRNAIFRARKDFSQNIEVRPTWEPGDVPRLVNDAIADGIARIIIGGGDGTVNEVIDALANLQEENRPEVAIIPLGTANDFATGCQIPGDFFEALALAVNGSAVPVDIVRANERHFINVASGGFGAEITRDTNVQLKNFIGGKSYTLTGLVKAIDFKPYSGVVKTADVELNGGMCVGFVCNGRLAGGGQVLAQNAFINDGLLDILVLLDFPLTALDKVIAEILDPSASGDYVKRFQGQWVEYISDKPVPLNLDGEPYTSSHIRFDVVPKAVKLVLPDRCPCLQ